MSDGEVLIRAEHVSKKFCRSLKRSLWYGAQDVANSLMPWKRDPGSTGANDDMVFREPELRKDEFWAVRDVSFEVRRGECLGLIGHNGAGKSTLLKILNSLNRPDSGRITMKGRVGALIELSAGFNPILTGRENIYNQAALLGFSSNETNAKFDAIVDFSELEEFLDTPMQNYSSGMKVRLGFAVSSQMQPDILLLDEVLAVGDAGFRFKCLNAIGEILTSAAVIFISHSIPQVARIATQVMLLQNGRNAFFDTNVGRGIDAYYNVFPNSRKQSAGSGDVVVENMNFVESGVAKTNCRVESGDAIELNIELSFSNTVNKCVIQLLLWNKEMVPVLNLIGPSWNGYVVRKNNKSRATVRLKTPPLHLNGGRYDISFIATDEAHRKMYCRVDNSMSLEVNYRFNSGAVMLMEGEWELLG